MANFLELVTGLREQTDDSPGHVFPSSEHDNFFADRDTAGSAHHQPSLPSFPEAFGGANDCHRQSFFPSSLCPLYGGGFLQEPQCRQTELQMPLPPSPPANNVPRAALARGVTDLAPLHLGNSYNRNNNDNPCQTSISEPPALQWPDGVLADGSFPSTSLHLPEAPLPHSQDPRQCLEYQQLEQHQHQPFGNYLVNNPHPHPSNIPGLGGLDLYLNLHHTSHSLDSHCTTQQQQPPSTSEVPLPLPLPRPVFSPTTTAPSTARPDHESTPFSNQAPPLSTPEHSQLFPPVPPILSRDQFADTPQPHIPGAHFGDPFFAPYRFNDLDPFVYDPYPYPYWDSPMTSAFGFNSDSFEPEAAMPSLANPSSARRRSSRRLSNSVVDLTKEESRDNITSSSPVPMAPPPPSRKRRRSTTASGGTSAPNTRRTSASQASKAIKTEAKRPGSRSGDTGVFGSSPPPAVHSDEDVLDLTEANEVSVAQKKIEADRRVKLSKFQCVICMDDVSNLTVTHCGKVGSTSDFLRYL
jgi:hypothetical protein